MPTIHGQMTRILYNNDCQTHLILHGETMITQYYRAQSLEEALDMLSKPDNRPLGGGTWLNQPHDELFGVVDLQALGLNKIRKTGNTLEIGACASLQQLLELDECPLALKQALMNEFGLNMRNAATVAGALITSDGRSAFATCMLALDAKLLLKRKQFSETIGLGDFLALRHGGLITEISIPLNTKSAFEMVARSPKDKPIVCACVVRWSGGRTRLALGGFGKCAALAMDGTEADGIDSAARNAFYEAGDEWASAEYRMEIAATLAKRCMEALE
jgi:CO/xanthine dehydrogenase FAD-binding subunit